MKVVPVKRFSKPYQILSWLHDSQALIDHPTSEWCKMFGVKDHECQVVIKKHGNDDIPLSQFIRRYVARDLNTRPTFAPERPQKVYSFAGGDGSMPSTGRTEFKDITGGRSEYLAVLSDDYDKEFPEEELE